MSKVITLQEKITTLEKEIVALKDQLDFEHSKHTEWKSLASMFHDTLWKMIDKYIMAEEK